MTVNVNIGAQDWQATAAELAGENMRLRAALQAAGRELNLLISSVGGETIEEDAESRADDNNSSDDGPPEDEKQE